MTISSFLFIFLLYSPIAHANIREGLVGWWKLDETSGTTAIDWSGQNNNGTYNGTTARSAVYCKRSGCRNFNGLSDYINIGNVLNMGLNSWTVSAWFKTTDTVGFGGIVTKSLYGVQDGRWYLIMNNPGVGNNLEAGITASGGAVTVSTTGTPYQDGEWHLMTGVWDRSGNLTLYIDGVSKNSSNISAYNNINMSTSDILYVGVYGDNTGLAPKSNAYFKGAIDDVRIYNRVLSAQEVSDLYRSGIVLRSGVWRNAKFNQ